MNYAADVLRSISRNRTPYIAQSEASECALACLAMIASFHGYDTDLIALRQRHSMSLKGATLKQVIRVAEDIGFVARPLRGEIEDLPHLALPAMLHWDLNHFVVLTKIEHGIRGMRYRIHDPARGVLVIDREQLSRQFTGVAVDFLKSETFKSTSDRRELRVGQLWSSLAGFWQTIRQVALLSVVLQIVALAMPFFLQVSIDSVFPSFDRDLLLVLAISFGGLAIIQFLAGWLRSLILLTLNNMLSYQVIVNLFRHMVRLPLDWFEKRHVGDIVSRFGSTQPISQLLSQGMIATFVDGLMATLTLCLMFFYSGVLSALALAALFAYIGIRLLFLHALKLSNLNVITALAKENSVFIETIRGIAAVKAFGQEANRQRLWQKSKAESVNASIRLGRLTAAFDAICSLTLALEKVVFVYLAVNLALDSKLSIGMIIAFQAYKQQFLDAGSRLTDGAINYNLIKVHLSRISDIALARSENDGTPSSRAEPDFSQGLFLRDVWYRYGFNERDVLRSVNIRLEPGEMVALVGPSGGGKTTLLKILGGLFEPSHGEIFVGSRALAGFDKQTYRQCIGSVAQDDSLYAGSIADNIAFFDPEIDMERVEEVAKMAHVHNDIASLPLQYETRIGDMGSVLSGGQKQRVLLARALYAKPKMLLIDEGTSHLDIDTEQSVLDILSNLNILRVVIAHRPQAIAAADRVIEVRDGFVLSRG
jgi:ATP-binding cassette subfamily B protein RaxB